MLAVILLAACGRTSRNSDTTPDADSGGSAPTGGSRGDADASLSDCDVPDKGPQPGPRVDGPPATGVSCSALGDSVILQRATDPASKVPMGLFYEQPGALIHWGPGCLDSELEVSYLAQQSLGDPQSTAATEWFFEAQVCASKVRNVFREPRCDYFNGRVFHGKNLEDFVLLSSLLWWNDNSNLSGAVLLGYSTSTGGATDWVELCSLTTSYGDFGLCDQISLYSTTNAVKYDGQVMLGEPKLVRTLKGQCH